MYYNEKLQENEQAILLNAKTMYNAGQDLPFFKDEDLLQPVPVYKIRVRESVYEYDSETLRDADFFALENKIIEATDKPLSDVRTYNKEIKKFAKAVTTGDAVKALSRLEKGRKYLMDVKPSLLNAKDCLTAFGFNTDGSDK